MISQAGVVVTTEMALTLAQSAGVCVRPMVRRVTDRATGDTINVPIPCGSTRESKCPPCAGKAARLRMHQCREGWHATDETLPDPEDKPVPAAATGEDGDQDDDEGQRRTRPTRRREDAPPLPRHPVEHRSVGIAFTDPKTGKTYRPSMFVTLTLASYGRITSGRGVPVNPRAYDYRRAALDALHFPKVIDRWVQNLRRASGFKVQYFAAIEPQKRLAPHLHAAIRGAIPRATIRAVTAATYHQVWWPAHDVPVYSDPDRLPTWDRDARCYRCPETGRPLTTWAQAMDDLDANPYAAPAHVVWFGKQVDVKGIIAPSADADRAIRYLCKYLTKSITAYSGNASNPHTSTDPDAIDWEFEAHIDRLHAEVLVLPCSTTCANWLRYGIQPADAGPGLIPGQCTSKAHDRECLGVGGRRVLVSRSWTGKTLTQHKADRADVVRAALEAAGIEPPEARRAAADVLHSDGEPRYVWEDVPLAERDYAEVIVASIAQHRAWKAEHEHAKALAAQRLIPPQEPLGNRSATPTAGEGTAA